MLEELHDGWLLLQTWWEDLSLDGQAFVRGSGVLLAALLLGQLLGWIIRSKLRTHNFDAALRVPWARFAGGPTDSRPGIATRLAGLLVRLTVWGAAVWWLAVEQGWLGLSRTLEVLGERAWALAGIVVVALYLGRFFAGQLIDFVQGLPLKEKLEVWLPPPSNREQRPAPLAVLAGTVVYGVVVLLLLLIASDLLGWTMTGNLVMAVWQLVLRLLTAALILVIGWFGTRWAHAQASPDAEAVSFPAQARSYTVLGIVGLTTLLALLVLLSNTPALLALGALLFLLVFLVWPVWGYMADFWAGMLLRSQNVQQVRIDNEWFQIKEIGMILTHLSRAGDELLTRRNRLVLEAHLQTPPTSEAPPAP